MKPTMTALAAQLLAQEKVIEALRKEVGQLRERVAVAESRAQPLPVIGQPLRQTGPYDPFKAGDYFLRA